MADAYHYDATLVFKEDWKATLQQELDEPVKWKDICNVEYSDYKIIHNPYLTDMTVRTLYRGTAYSMEAITQTDEYTTINQARIAAQFKDRADLAQFGYSSQMEVAKRQGILLNEAIESAVLGAYGSMTDFGTEDLAGTAGGTTAITVSTTNIDDIVTFLISTIRTANGEGLLNQNGGFVVWRPADFQKLTTFMMANGFNVADAALKNGAKQGVEYMGMTHYTSNLLTSGHVIAGIKKIIHLGILRSTFGQVIITQDPGLNSGIGIISRVDYAVKVWTKTKAVVFDVNVA